MLPYRLHGAVTPLSQVLSGCPGLCRSGWSRVDRPAPVLAGVVDQRSAALRRGWHSRGHRIADQATRRHRYAASAVEQRSFRAGGVPGPSSASWRLTPSYRSVAPSPSRPRPSRRKISWFSFRPGRSHSPLTPAIAPRDHRAQQRNQFATVLGDRVEDLNWSARNHSAFD